MPKKKTKQKKKKPKKVQEKPKFYNVNKNLNVVHINSNLNKPKKKRPRKKKTSNLPLLQNLNLQNQLRNMESQIQQERLNRDFALQPIQIEQQRSRTRAISSSPTLFYNFDTPREQGLPARLPIKSSPQDIFQTPPSTSRPAPRQLVEEPRRGTRPTTTPARFRGFETNLPRRRR